MANICDLKAHIRCVAKETYQRFGHREAVELTEATSLLCLRSALLEANYITSFLCPAVTRLPFQSLWDFLSLSHQPPPVFIQKLSDPPQQHFLVRNRGQLCLLRSRRLPRVASLLSQTEVAIHRHGLLSHLATLWKSLLSPLCLGKYPPKIPVTHQTLCEKKI